MTEHNALEQEAAADKFMAESIAKCMKEGYSRPQALYMLSLANYQLRQAVVRTATEKAWLEAGLTFHRGMSNEDLEKKVTISMGIEEKHNFQKAYEVLSAAFEDMWSWCIETMEQLGRPELASIKEIFVESNRIIYREKLADLCLRLRA